MKSERLSMKPRHRVKKKRKEKSFAWEVVQEKKTSFGFLFNPQIKENAWEFDYCTITEKKKIIHCGMSESKEK